MNTAELTTAGSIASTRKEPGHLGKLIAAMLAFELITVCLMLPSISAQIDKAMSISPLLRQEMRPMIFVSVVFITPLLKVMAMGLWTVLVDAMRQGCRLKGDYLAYALAVFTAGLVMGFGRIVNMLVVRLAGGASYSRDSFAIGTWMPRLTEYAGWLAKLNLWDLLAFAIFVAAIRTAASLKPRVALAFGTIAWLVPLLACCRIQQIMGH